MDKIWSREEQDAVLRFVRSVLNAEFTGAPDPAAPAIPELEKTGSCFVTLHGPAGELRGCIGNLQAFESLGENLRHNALNAAFRDPRFPALDPEELPEITLEVSILSAPEPIRSIQEFEIGRHGIILQKSGRSAVFLPQVAPEQGWDRKTTLTYLSRKAGLADDAWQYADARFFVFTATVFGE